MLPALPRVLSFFLTLLVSLIAGTLPAAGTHAGSALNTTAPAATRTLTYSEYDARNRLRTFIDARGKTIGYRYDAAGNLTQLIYPEGIGTVTYTYDTHNRLETVTDWANRTTRYHYDLSGNLIRTQHANGTQRRHAIDAAGQASGISELSAANQPKMNPRANQ